MFTRVDLKQMNYLFKFNIFIIVILSLIITPLNARGAIVNGGQVSIFGAVTDTQIDLKIDYTANVKWILMIWGPDQVNTDAHLFQIDQNNAANPVLVRDCYINQLSYITIDDVNNIQPSVTDFKGDIRTGIKAAYNRDLNTFDSEDIRLYPNSVVQVCFISSTLPFQGKGFQKANQKVCSFLSLHQNSDDYQQDRLLGNYAGTTLFGGGNLTLYATKSTDGSTIEPWLFISVVHKQQGLSPFKARWIGVTYQDSLTQTDLGMISYQMLNFKLQVHTRDMWAQTSINAKQDQAYTVKQGGNDVVKIYGAYDPSSYLVASYKRKLSTGDLNRDIVLKSGQSRYCFIYGNNLQFSGFAQQEKACIELNLKTNYLSSFRVATKNATTDQTVIEYKKPNNTVIIKKKYENWLNYSYFLLLLLALLAINY